MDKRIKKLILLIFDENTPVYTPSTPKKIIRPILSGLRPVSAENDLGCKPNR
jgi:hypothetical protein